MRHYTSIDAGTADGHRAFGGTERRLSATAASVQEIFSVPAWLLWRKMKQYGLSS
jgi:hypothetical protein